MLFCIMLFCITSVLYQIAPPSARGWPAASSRIPRAEGEPRSGGYRGAFSAQYERSWRVLPVSGGVLGAIFERARLFCERAGIEPARVRVCRLSALPSFYAASMSPSSFSSSHVSSFRFTLIPPKTDLSSLSTFMTTCRSIARFSARSSRLARDLSSRRPAAVQSWLPCLLLVLAIWYNAESLNGVCRRIR